MQHVDAFSNSLAQKGVEKGTEIPVCMTLCPEFVYLLLGASKLGAVLNIFGDWFSDDYVREILQRSTFDEYHAKRNLSAMENLFAGYVNARLDKYLKILQD